MKVIEKIITYEDYNYVEGSLQFNAYGHKTRELLHAEYFSIDRISHVHFEIEKKYLPPELPPGINKNKVSTLTLPDKIKTIIDGDYDKPYGIAYDEIIVDDSYVDDNQNIKGPRFNSTKIGSEISSTVAIKVYGLIKIERQRTENENQFEITTIANGPGIIKISPIKESYSTEEKVSIKALANQKSIFVGFKNEFENSPKEFELVIGEEDITIEASFIDKKKAEEILNAKNGHDFSKNSLENIKAEYDKIQLQEQKGYAQKIKDNWKDKSVKNKYLGVEAHGFWDIVSLIFSLGFYILTLLFLIAVFGKGLFIISLILLGFWLISLIPSSLFSWRGFQWIAGFLFCLMIIAGFINIVENYDNNSYRKKKQSNNPIVEAKKIENENTTIDYMHHLVWNDYNKNEYEIELIINSDLVENASKFKSSHPVVSDEASYSKLLSNLYQIAIKDDYVRVIDKLDSIKKINRLNKKGFSSVIVSMVQSIPYYAIVQESCNPYSYQDPAIRQLLFQQPCEPYQRFGIKSPAEFLMNLKGDCDTRTLFLYGLLKSLDYDVVIFGSQKYKHSVLGISLDIEAPHFKTLDDKKYFLWEVTDKDFQPGVLPEHIANLNYWNINLK